MEHGAYLLELHAHGLQLITDDLNDYEELVAPS
jgi:hypothetical protein